MAKLALADLQRFVQALSFTVEKFQFSKLQTRMPCTLVSLSGLLGDGTVLSLGMVRIFSSWVVP